ncbi:hypothetical protein N658DRAFT_515481 [Parathielavia hyrcaniae]|uniref:Uncharacterized protein n=1 Tax=Parathielavia hyrcaniae TaxID=113614 RepID=A0AAN6Q3Q6_9PEZI|nr:hypothetical protein N658DRAFT_515481 [Parathielavia hyrcaniae]
MAAISPRWEGILGIEEAQMLQAAMSEAHLVLHGPPDFPIDAEILGVCGVSAENADQNKYGWIVADFLHWKTAFHATWLSSLDISEFLAGIDGVDVVSDGIIHKVLGDNNQDISSIPDNNNGFEAEFLKRLTTTLVVLIFAPITPEQDICVDLGNQSRTYLTIDRLRQTIQDAVGNAQLAVTLVTPSPFTGGWACRPSILGPLGCPNLQNMMRLIAKSCGGAFATRFIQSFTERSTPFMTQDQRANVKYDDPMPLRPTELQVKSLHQFQRQIHESLEHHFSVFAKDHAFILQPDAARDPASFVDSWTEYAPRQGYRLETWARRWAKPRAAIDYANRFEFFGEAFGGTQESQFFHLKYLAAIELDTCPTDWNRHVSGATAELFTGFLERAMPGEYDVKRVFDAIEFRASSNILAQVLAKVFNLPLPDGVMCRYWHDTPDGVSDEHYRRLQDGFGMTNGLFEQAAVLPSEKTHEIKSVKYLRSARWLAAATAWRFENGSREDVEHFMTINVARFMDKIRDTQQTLLLEDRALQRKGLNWIAALGLGGEVKSSTLRPP